MAFRDRERHAVLRASVGPEPVPVRMQIAALNCPQCHKPDTLVMPFGSAATAS